MTFQPPLPVAILLGIVDGSWNSLPDFKRRFFSWRIAQYMSREVVLNLVIGTTVFLLIMLMFQIIRLADFMVVHQVSLRDVGRICLYLMFSFIPIAVPIGLLFSVIMGISRANSEGEILALQATGISLFQVFAPLLVFSVLVSLGCVLASFTVVPKSNRAFELLVTRLGNERAVASLKPGVFSEGFHGLVLFAEFIYPLRNEMKHVFIYDSRDEERPLAISAQGGILRNVEEKGILTLRLTDGNIIVEGKETERLQRIDFDVYDINLDIGVQGDFGRAYSPPSYDYTQLTQKIEETIHNVEQHRSLLVEYHRRFSLGFACTVFAALGFFIGILSKRGVRSTSILFCLMVAVLYWLSYVGANGLAMSGKLHPALAVWMSNGFFLLVAYFCSRRYAKG